MRHSARVVRVQARVRVLQQITKLNPPAANGDSELMRSRKLFGRVCVSAVCSLLTDAWPRSMAISCIPRSPGLAAYAPREVRLATGRGRARSGWILTCAQPAGAGSPTQARRVWRLTGAQYRNTIAALFTAGLRPAQRCRIHPRISKHPSTCCPAQPLRQLRARYGMSDADRQRVFG
jgi:hypothetical protein